MWPPHPDQQTAAAEATVEALYAGALQRWAPVAAAAVLPTLDAVIDGTAASPDPDGLPPDVEGIAAAQSAWDELVAAVIVPGVVEVWVAAAADAVGGGLTAALISRQRVAALFRQVRDDFLLQYGRAAAAVPGMVRDELALLLTHHAGDLAAARALVRAGVSPGSELLRTVARRMGFHAASILNHALMSVAERAGDADRKYWMSRRDPKVRVTHRVADGQVAPLGGSFTVGGAELAFPGDPRGPAREWRNCRCRLIVLAVGETVPEPWDGADEPLAASAADKEDTMSVDTDTDTAPEQMQPDVTTLEVTDTAPEVQPLGQEAETFRTFTDSTIAFIGTPTSDYRLLATDIDLSFRQFPLPLMWMRHTGDGGHVDAFTVGVVEDARVDGDRVYASGYLLNTAEAEEAAVQLEHQVTRPSVDMTSAEWHLSDEDGKELTEDEWWALPLNAKVFRTFTAAEIMGFTLVATPAFGDTQLTLNPERESRAAGLVAAAAAVPRIYPAGLFTDPQLPEPTLPTMGEDGRVVGHIACWGTCHRSVQAACITAPHSPTDYSHFHTSPAVRLDDNTRLPVGRLTVGTGHAADNLAGVPAQAHYDNTGTCWALVRVGEDAHGIWFSGVTAPWATPEQIEAGLCAPLSGDWRDFGQGLELVAALSVNTPGFAARGRDDDLGRPAALVAALGPGPDAPRRELTRDDIKAAVAEAITEQRLAAERDAQLAAEAAERDAALERAAKFTHPKTPKELIGEMLAKAAMTW